MTKPRLAMLTQLSERYGTIEIVSTVAAVQPDGELHNVQWSIGGFEPGAEYDGLRIRAYIGTPGGLSPVDSERGVWGTAVDYQPHRIDSAKQASAIARVFNRIDKGREKLTTDEGYINDDQYALHVFRVCRILGIKLNYVSNSKRSRDMSGETFRAVNATGLQYYVSTLASDVHEGRKHEYIGR